MMAETEIKEWDEYQKSYEYCSVCKRTTYRTYRFLVRGPNRHRGRRVETLSEKCDTCKTEFVK